MMNAPHAVLAAVCVLVTVSVDGQQRQLKRARRSSRPAPSSWSRTSWSATRRKDGPRPQTRRGRRLRGRRQQEVVSFTLRAAGDAEPAPRTSVGKAVDRAVAAVTGEPAPPRHINLVTLIFDQLGADGRQIARQAGLALLDLSNRPDLVVSVFQVRESLRLVQQFTSERELLNTAIREATGDLNTQ